MSSYLITGSARGLGFGLVQLLASKPTSEVKLVFAAGRKANDALSNLVKANPGRVYFIELELGDATSVQKAVKEVEIILAKHNATLDVLVNNAAILLPSPDGVDTMSDLEESLRINVVGTQLVSAGFLPLLKQGKGKKIANVSSVLGSLTLSAKVFGKFPAPGYHISKTATGMLTRQYAHQLEKDGFSVFVLSPGWVKTDMGQEGADLTVEESVAGILNLVQNATKDTNGKFFNIRVPGWENGPKGTGAFAYDGAEIPW